MVAGGAAVASGAESRAIDKGYRPSRDTITMASGPIGIGPGHGPPTYTID